MTPNGLVGIDQPGPSKEIDTAIAVDKLTPAEERPHFAAPQLKTQAEDSLRSFVGAGLGRATRSPA
jgi:hypothetical protein